MLSNLVVSEGRQYYPCFANVVLYLTMHQKLLCHDLISNTLPFCLFKLNLTILVMWIWPLLWHIIFRVPPLKSVQLLPYDIPVFGYDVDSVDKPKTDAQVDQIGTKELTLKLSDWTCSRRPADTCRLPPAAAFAPGLIDSLHVSADPPRQVCRTRSFVILPTYGHHRSGDTPVEYTGIRIVSNEKTQLRVSRTFYKRMQSPIDAFYCQRQRDSFIRTYVSYQKIIASVCALLPET